MRVVRGLRWAKKSSEVPGFAKGAKRPRGAKALGLRYERSVAAELGPSAQQSVWWEYEDTEGIFWCQTDLLMLGKTRALVLECKYTATNEGWKQLEQLYIPVVSLALNREVFGCQVAKLLFGQQPGAVICKTVEEAVTVAKQGQRPLVHWKGLGRLIGGG